jgi:dihydroxy-acid dehydratase
MSLESTPNRSREWFDTPELYGWLRRAAFKAEGFTENSYEGKPIIGICNTWSELTHCNSHLRDLAESVKIGVWQAGGFPMEFPVMSLGEYNMKPTTMLFRNLMSMDVEESITANPIDGVVLLGGCDKTTPALLMGAASADIPAILVTGGPQLKGNWKAPGLPNTNLYRLCQVSEMRVTMGEFAPGVTYSYNGLTFVRIFSEPLSLKSCSSQPSVQFGCIEPFTTSIWRGL